MGEIIPLFTEDTTHEPCQAASRHGHPVILVYSVQLYMYGPDSYCEVSRSELLVSGGVAECHQSVVTVTPSITTKLPVLLLLLLPVG